MAVTPKPSHLVVVLAPEPSSSLSALLSSIPKDLDAAVVVAPEVKASGFDALASAHQLREIRATTELGRAVYLAPARSLEVLDGSIKVLDGDGASAGVERFVDSAADAYGERLILVLLTGSGSKAVEAAVAVGNNGGTLIVERPRSGMKPIPASLPPTTVDIFSEPENVGEVLRGLVASDGDVAAGEAKLVETILERIRDRNGIDFTSYKLPTIKRRLERRMASVGAPRLGDYMVYLNQHPEEYQRLISSFLIKVTDFFRDAQVFTNIREKVLPEVIEAAGKNSHELRVWSAGCATGEEAYSLAILFAEALGDSLRDFSIRIFATDVDADAVAFARQGVYPAAALRKMPPGLVAKYFLARDGEFEVGKRIRSMVVFGQHDLAERAPFPRVDLIVCRNVLIYFTEELQMRTLQLFAFALRNNGFLVLGAAENTTVLPEQFAQEDPHLKIFRRRGERMLIPPPRRRAAPAIATFGRRGGAGEQDHAVRRTTNVLDRADRLLVNLPVGIVVVDRRYDVQHINAAARRLLAIRSAGVGEDFVHLATLLPPGQLRGMLDGALRGEAATRTYTVDSEDGDKHLEIASHPGYVESIEGGDTAVVVINDVTEAVRARKEAETARDAQGAEMTALRSRMDQMSAANQQLVEANEDLALQNMDLRRTNDELQVSNEEVQAATEEVETLNEELQATNEELETLNEELQATVEELNTTNDDLLQRSQELESLARTLETQRTEASAKRAALLATLAEQGAVAVVDANGKVIASSAQFNELMPDGEFVGAEGDALGPSETPVARAARGESYEATLTARSGTAKGRKVRVRVEGAEGGGGIVRVEEARR